MDLFDLVYQVRMDLEEARLSNRKVQLYKDLAKRRLRKKIASLEADSDSDCGDKTQQAAAKDNSSVLKCLSGEVEGQHLHVLEKKLERVQTRQAEESQAQTSGLVTFLEALCEDLKEESTKFEVLLAAKGNSLSEAKLGCSRFSSSSCGISRNSSSGSSRFQLMNELIDYSAIQTILDDLSNAISHMKSVNRQARDEMMILMGSQKIFRCQTSSLQLALSEKLMQQDESKKERMKKELEVDISQKVAKEFMEKLKVQEISQGKEHKDLLPSPQLQMLASTCGEKVKHASTADNGCWSQLDFTAAAAGISSGTSLGDKTSLVQVLGWAEDESLRIRELKLQLRRMEYRARNAEDCCDQLKRELNHRIIGYSTNEAMSTSGDNFTVSGSHNLQHYVTYR